MHQHEIDASVDWAVANLTGKVKDAAGHYGGECLSLIKQEYTHRTGEPAPSAGGWADGYLKLPGNLRRYFTVEKFDRNKAYPKGSYAVFTPTHHIMLYLGKFGDNATVFEQNADPDHSPAHISTRDGARIDYIMVPIITPEQPPAPLPVTHPYRIEHIDPKQVKLKVDTHKWGLNYDNWTAIKNNPEGSASKDDIKTVQAILHHDLGSSYYLENPDVPSGYNVVDCADYTPPVAAPKPPSAPVPFPANDEKYRVLTTVLAFTNSNNAVNHLSAVGTVRPGEYFVFKKRTGMGGDVIAINITKTKGVAGSWINPRDNVPEKPKVIETPKPIEVPKPIEAAPIQIETPAPVIVPQVPVNPPHRIDWRGTNQPILPNWQPVRVVTNNTDDVTIYDQEHPDKSIVLTPFREVDIVSTFVKDGITYARPAAAAKQFRWFGIPYELVIDQDPKLTFADVTGQLLYKARLLIQDIKKYVTK